MAKAGGIIVSIEHLARLRKACRTEEVLGDAWRESVEMAIEQDRQG